MHLAISVASSSRQDPCPRSSSREACAGEPVQAVRELWISSWAISAATDPPSTVADEPRRPLRRVEPTGHPLSDDVGEAAGVTANYRSTSRGGLSRNQSERLGVYDGTNYHVSHLQKQRSADRRSGPLRGRFRGRASQLYQDVHAIPRWYWPNSYDLPARRACPGRRHSLAPFTCSTGWPYKPSGPVRRRTSTCSVSRFLGQVEDNRGGLRTCSGSCCFTGLRSPAPDRSTARAAPAASDRHATRTPGRDPPLSERERPERRKPRGR